MQCRKRINRETVSVSELNFELRKGGLDIAAD
jgi:hypothetical protein